MYLCGAQFAEQVFVGKPLTLTGDPTSGLTAVGTTFTTSTASYPAVVTTAALFAPQALLVTTGDGVRVSGLTFSGPMTGNGGCGDVEYGILALTGSITIDRDQVLNIADANTGLYGCQFGVGIEIGSQQWPTSSLSTFDTVNLAARADIADSSVSGYQKNGITVDGPGRSADIDGIAVAAGGPGAPFGTIIAQNGGTPYNG